MSTVTVNYVDHDQADDSLPPPGTAIVRPLRHVRAVRERHLQRFTDPAEAAVSRSARAWSWALGETDLAPVTDQQTATPPDRTAIEVEIAIADERRLRGERESRADAAATILRWLIGDDDHVPVRCENPGELVGGFGDIVRSREQISSLLAATTENQRRPASMSRKADASPDQRQCASRDADYLTGVAATLSWALGQSASPITRRESQPTTKDLKTERLQAEDLIGQADLASSARHPLSSCHGEGVKSTIAWLLGDRTTLSVEHGL